MGADFSGYATKANIKCSDGRTISPQAFQHMDKEIVPLVWQHGHDTPTNVLGHAVLEARSDGIYAYGYFNDTDQGKVARALVKHKDVNKLSIFANQLVEKMVNGSKAVFHGVIREVSLVLAGANPGAFIDTVSMEHGDGSIVEIDDAAIIHTGLEIDVLIEDDEVEDDGNLEHAANAERTVQDVYDSMTEEQKTVVAFMVGQAIQDSSSSDGNAAHSSTSNDGNIADDASNGDDKSSSDDAGSGDLSHEEGTIVTRNVFEQNKDQATAGGVLRHEMTADDVRGIVENAKRYGSLKDAVTSYALKHGIDSIDVLFPDAKTITDTPEFNKRRTEWVQAVLNGTRHVPFSRIKTVTADITQEEARARGYIKGHYKIEEWFGVNKRTTTPTTIYKKQQLDRDDVLDISDFDSVAWLKGEMRIMLDEEIATAILIGDGRQVTDEDKIKDPLGASDGAGIRSIANEHELFKTELIVDVSGPNPNYEDVVDAVIDGMEFYKGTGTPTFFTTIKHLNMFLKAKDLNGQRYYKNKQEVADALGVSQVVTVETMSRDSSLIGIIVNLDDYAVGTDRGGEVTLFDDFDIDYNKQKYLMETRLSGALTKIKSALVLRAAASSSVMLVTPTAPTYDADTYVVTIPTVTHVTYKNADTGATLSPGAQSALTVGQTLNVEATADSGYYFANDAGAHWVFFRRI